MKVIIACGGTGGHLFPGLAIADLLQARRHQVRLLVSEKAIDQTALAALTDCSVPLAPIAVQALPAVAYEGSSRLTRFCFRLARATRVCAVACDEFQPDVVLGMGGFTSVPALFAARWFRRRGTAALIHESNAVPGKANRWVGRFADHVAVGLSDCARFFGRKPVTVTGTPVRAALREWSRQGGTANARAQLGLRPERATVLVAGGSQGAHAINVAVSKALTWLNGKFANVQFVHLSGLCDQRFMQEAYERNGFEAKVMSFCDHMEMAYGAADLVVARSGASTLTELAAFSRPSILIPYPQAAGNHQWHNARVFERAGAAVVIEQSELNGLHAPAGQPLAEAIGRLLTDANERRHLAQAARSLAVDDATERIAALVEQYGR
ncbi:MAG TPA: undecaprenyldiphospho-muramoylpentapeptide beta-N-acetylglucosaminyltransferase [Verrucomicrobiae bacterium]|nr:undecaprenyldiphospho-muramoylpentapeptide beta-N-acetylglucosaminyltransferase [Verrucomicrobiae bacterium]